jgi:hypothetical protein
MRADGNVIFSHLFITMAFTNLTDPPEIKFKFLKPQQMLTPLLCGYTGCWSVGIPLPKCHTATVHLMSPKKKVNR